MNLLGMLRNIPLDPVVQRALEAHPQEPLLRGVKAWFVSLGELIVTFILSISPGWNIDVYVRVVYHSWFKRTINDIVQRRQEAELVRQDEIARQERIKAELEQEPEIKEDENPRVSEGSEEWPEDGTIIKERKHREAREDMEEKSGRIGDHQKENIPELNEIHQKLE